MKSQGALVHRLVQVLRHAHATRPLPPLDSRWPETVMRRIRSLPEPAGSGGWPFGLLVWRLAPATGVLALLALAVLLRFSLIPDAELFRLWYSEPQLLGLAGF
ncbi:MAG TPA: hypothetical protein ENF48_04865 [Desulfobacteraceae bacterium]|nr:hypothetical protein [Deltaproteobacteria bacterium]RLB97968.1 MAG: hypothetical protein DRH76_03695 [Deltaproteobacteria bacterium]HDI59680.1 hypothetical protein [Desulfobacteraceae bacterium]